MVVRFPSIGKTMHTFQTGTKALRIPPSLIAQPLMLSLDIDETLIPWQKQPHYNNIALERYSRLLNQPEIRKNSFILFNTGRGLNGTQALTPILKKFPVDALGLNDGQQLFLQPPTNKGITTESKPDTEAWLCNLTPKDEDIHWNEELQGWATCHVMQAASQGLSKLGFALQDTNAAKSIEVTTEGIPQLFSKPMDAKEPNGTQWVVKLYPDQAYMEVTRSDRKAEREAIASYADHLGAYLQTHLQSNWPKASYYTNVANKRTYVHIGPAGNSKGSLVRHLVETRFHAKPKAVVSAGDSFNDRDILSAEQFGDTPNYPIQIGKHAALSAYLETSRPKHLEKTEADQLDTGLRKQLAKLQDKLPFLKFKTPPPNEPVSTEKELHRKGNRPPAEDDLFIRFDDDGDA